MEQINKNFIYGVSSSAFQVEGDDGTQGRGKSIWDTFCEEKGRIFNNDNGKVAIDHYNRYKEDVRLMEELGVNGDRFSISWSRLLPDGMGKVNQKGVDFYDKLIDSLLEKNIIPYLTFFHWDLPQTLSNKGGFYNPDISKWFGEYASLVVDKFGDRVKNYITFNEPINIVHNGYYTGVFAPGSQLGSVKAGLCLANLHKAHFEATKIIHDNVKNSQVGFAMSTFEEYPYTQDEQCIEMAKKKYFERSLLTESVDMYLDPILLGKYPSRVEKDFPEFVEAVGDLDLSKIFEKMDFLGLNNYGGYPVDKDGNYVKRELGDRISDIGVPIDSNGLYWSCKFCEERYGLPIVITENGFCNADQLAKDGKVYDEKRVLYFKEHLAVVEKLKKECCNLRGYFVWTLHDNFEWLFGYSKRFGLIYIDYNTLERIPKQSYYWYKDYIRVQKDK